MSVELPDQARAKLLAITGAAQAAEDAMAGATQRLNSMNKGAADPAIVKQIEKRRTKDTQRHAVLAALTGRVKQWLRTLPPDTVLKPATVAARAGENLTLGETVAATRDAIAAAVRHLAVVHNAPLPTDDVKALAAAHVEAPAQRSRPKVSVDGGNFSVTFADPKADMWCSGDYVAELLACVAPDLLIGALHREIDRMRPRSIRYRRQRRRRASSSCPIASMSCRASRKV
jgi:hypothetical protein